MQGRLGSSDCSSDAVVRLTLPVPEFFLQEILLAGDTNRLVAELTFVRINDLASPPEKLHPLMYIEPLVATLIVGNGIMIGFQTVSSQQSSSHALDPMARTKGFARRYSFPLTFPISPFGARRLFGGWQFNGPTGLTKRSNGERNSERKRERERERERERDERERGTPSLNQLIERAIQMPVGRSDLVTPSLGFLTGPGRGGPALGSRYIWVCVFLPCQFFSLRGRWGLGEPYPRIIPRTIPRAIPRVIPLKKHKK